MSKNELKVTVFMHGYALKAESGSDLLDYLSNETCPVCGDSSDEVDLSNIATKPFSWRCSGCGLEVDVEVE